jgi:hypothetical protein
MFELVAWLLIATLIVIPAWRILRKAGFIAALSLVLIVPILGWFFITIVLAFVPWPTLKRRTDADIAATFE